ncbi:uncharacterized protein LOC142348291 isoform X1 [Convolutriloba macropyga]|uniref:uncharacterized protein LOC142348291 isoform X1 n=1 Tax=Convolutriloba macropyga TaxID=536237 RepID=UPI003F52406D
MISNLIIFIALLSPFLLLMSQFAEAASVFVAVKSDWENERGYQPQVEKCDGKDYFLCALLIAGCSTKCSGNGDVYSCMVNCLIIKNQDCVKCIPQYRRHPLLSLTGSNVVDDDSRLFGGAQGVNKAERFQKTN